MIIVKYNGGLGNQIFQYVTAMSLGKKLGCEVFFDMSFFDKKYSRPYEMGIFGIESKRNNDLRVPLYWTIRKFIKSDKFLGLNVYHEHEQHFEERFEKIEDNTFVEGFFQSPKYFDKEIAKSIDFKVGIDEANLVIAQKMNSENSVSIHIRRGDYVNKKRYFDMFEHLDIEHYKKAIEVIKERIDNPIFYVFSDDMDWVRENLKLDNAQYISHNSGEKSWCDMFLMSKCKHNIIANSSFSWWGAYLNRNEGKIVIAPKKWFKNDVKSNEDKYPKEWTLI